LLYANDGNPEFKLARRTHTDIAPSTGKQQLLFVLRSLPEWGLGGNHPRFKLLLPPHSRVRITRISVLPSTQLMPVVDFANSGYLGTKGYLHLTPALARQDILVDASAIPGAVSTLLEVTRPNMFFEEQNSRTQSKIQGKIMPAPLKGTVKLDRKDFGTDGLYELRVWAVDSNGNTLAVASDHIAVSVDP
jgi:hypothetical protein